LISGRPEGRILNRGPPDKKGSSNHLKCTCLTISLILKFLVLETQAAKQETKLKLIIWHLGAEYGQRYYDGNNYKKQLQTASKKSETENERKRVHKEWKSREVANPTPVGWWPTPSARAWPRWSIWMVGFIVVRLFEIIKNRWLSNSKFSLSYFKIKENHMF